MIRAFTHSGWSRLIWGRLRLIGMASLCVIMAGAPVLQGNAGLLARNTDRSDIATLEKDRTALAVLQQADQHFQSLAWRLATANAPFCPDALPGIGLLLQDMQAYGTPERIRRASQTSGDIAVQAVAAGSPAQQAGLQPNDTILAMNGFDPATLPVPEKEKWRRTSDLQDMIDRALRRDGHITLVWQKPDGTRQTHRITGIPACPGRWELLIGKDTAEADGTRILFGANFPAFTYPDDELAAVMAHELAHNLLHHRAWLDINGRSRSNIRLTEREADRLMPWLLHNAGWAPDAAARFMEKWGRKHGGGLLRKRTHEGWDERVEWIEAEYPAISSSVRATGKADWAQSFQRNTGTLHPEFANKIETD
ncbi:MAG: PDZ domain-containing protein [Sphingomonadaceae bacterium]